MVLPIAAEFHNFIVDGWHIGANYYLKLSVGGHYPLYTFQSLQRFHIGSPRLLEHKPQPRHAMGQGIDITDAANIFDNFDWQELQIFP